MTNRLPPGPKLSRVGQYLLALRRHQAPDFLLGLARDYGDVTSFRAGGQRYVFLNHPDHVRDVLITRQENFLKWRGKPGRAVFLGEGLLVTEGEMHRQHRRLMQPSFHRQRLAGYAATIVEQGARRRDAWRDGETFDAAREMRRITLPSISKTMFQARSEGEADEVDRCMVGVMSHSRAFSVAPVRLLIKLPLPASRRFLRAQERLDAMIYRMIAERRRSGEDRGDLLSMLLQARGEDGGGGLSDQHVRDEAMAIFLAGYEPAALALAWTWYTLARHPEVEAALHEELDTVLGGRPPTFEDLPRLAYTERVLNESLRMYPPTWRVARWAVEDCEVGDYFVPGGSQVILSQYVLHHDPRYFPDPFRFDPDRWKPEAKASRPQYSFFPFGAGPHRCLGETFAVMEGVLILATLAQRWRMRPAPAAPRVEMQALHMLRPKRGIQMKVERRG